MPGIGRRWLSVSIAGVVCLMAIGCGSATDSADQQARADIKKINDYLGTVPANGQPQKSLLVTLNENNEYLRGVIKDMKCDIYKLQHPSEECPAGGSTPPANVPQYPQ